MLAIIRSQSHQMIVTYWRLDGQKYFALATAIWLLFYNLRTREIVFALWFIRLFVLWTFQSRTCPPVDEKKIEKNSAQLCQICVRHERFMFDCLNPELVNEFVHLSWRSFQEFAIGNKRKKRKKLFLERERFWCNIKSIWMNIADDLFAQNDYDERDCDAEKTVFIYFYFSSIDW